MTQYAQGFLSRGQAKNAVQSIVGTGEARRKTLAYMQGRFLPVELEKIYDVLGN
jgi:hypothetical protein